MLLFKDYLSSLKPILPLVGFVILLSLLLRFVHWLLIGRHKELSGERKFPRQMFVLILFIIALLVVIFLLPVGEDIRNQLLGIFGLIVSGLFAFSSTNIVRNFMSGVLLRITQPFKTGDFIRTDDYFGRVSQRGLFDTEIQSVNREFISLPHSYLVNHPITAVNSSGAIVSMKLSLGYDISHSIIEPLLIKAAENCGLKEPFTHILELGDFSITYRVSGLLEDVKWFVSAQSDLCRSVLDTLHAAKVEIVSPTFMNQRRIPENVLVIPPVDRYKTAHEKQMDDKDKAERIVFDKAEAAARIEDEMAEIQQQIDDIQNLLKSAKGNEKEKLQQRMESDRSRLKELEKIQDENKE